MTSDLSPQPDFDEVVAMITEAKHRAYQAVNMTLVELYWQVGQYISCKLGASEWGDGVVSQLADYLARKQPGLRGFTRRNLFHMRQIYETYRDDEKVSPLVTQIPWTQNLIILGHDIVEYEQGGKVRAEYGKALLSNLSRDLKQRHGRGFSRSNLVYMRLLYLNYPISQKPSDLLSWSHYVELLRIDGPLERVARLNPISRYDRTPSRFSPRRGSDKLAQGRAPRRKLQSAALGCDETIAVALKGRNNDAGSNAVIERHVVASRLCRPFRADDAVAYEPRAALRGYRRCALPWAGMCWPFRPEGNGTDGILTMIGGLSQ